MRIRYIFIRFLHFMSYKNFEQKTVFLFSKEKASLSLFCFFGPDNRLILSYYSLYPTKYKPLIPINALQRIIALPHQNYCPRKDMGVSCSMLESRGHFGCPLTSTGDWQMTSNKWFHYLIHIVQPTLPNLRVTLCQNDYLRRKSYLV
jgi:hypothetical protein